MQLSRKGKARVSQPQGCESSPVLCRLEYPEEWAQAPTLVSTVKMTLEAWVWVSYLEGMRTGEMTSLLLMAALKSAARAMMESSPGGADKGDLAG